MSDRRFKHGLTGQPIYNRWRNMLARCENPNHQNFHIYGGRGIHVCARWKSFENFYQDMGDLPYPGAQVDRIDGTKGYEPGNCRWATSKMNNNNRRDNVLLELNGKKQTLAQWSDETGLSGQLIQWRLKNGWPVDRALTQESRQCQTRSLA